MTHGRESAADAAGPRPTILFLIQGLGLGGAERSLITLMNHLRRYRPIAVVLRERLALLDELDPAIPLYSLDRPVGAPLARLGPAAGEWCKEPRTPPFWMAPPRLALYMDRLRRLVHRTGSQAVCTFLTKSHVVAYLARLVLGERLGLVINMHESLGEHLRIHWPRRAERVIVRSLLRLAYRKADSIVVVSPGLAPELASYGAPADRICALANPIDFERVRELAGQPVTHRVFDQPGARTVLSVGRLVPLKCFDVLIRAFARVPGELKARLVIIGDGPERRSLQALAEELAVGERVHLLGADLNPWRYMARATVFALSSRTEASPIVLGEALALGLPVVATDCGPGVREYLEGGAHGLLVERGNVDQLAAALKRLLADSRPPPGPQALVPSHIERHSAEVAVQAYEAMLKRVLHASRRG